MASKEKPGMIFWDPVTGCTFVDRDCSGCWASSFSNRRQTIGYPMFQFGFRPSEHPEALVAPSTWKYRHLVYVAALSDLFHESFSDDFILQVFEVMKEIPECEFLVQTKRSVRMAQLSPRITWTDNIWMGVSVTSTKNLDRIDHLRSTNARTKWVAFIPLTKEFPAVGLDSIDWVVVGPAHLAWNIEAYDQRKKSVIYSCKQRNIPYYEKSKEEYREFRRFDRKLFPKDLRKLGVIDGDPLVCTVVYYDKAFDRIMRKPFYGEIADCLKGVNQFISSLHDAVLIGLAVELDTHTKLENGMRAFADVQNVGLENIIDEFLAFAEPLGFDIRLNLAKLMKMKTPAREKQFTKLCLAMLLFYKEYYDKKMHERYPATSTSPSTS
jgi:protein gp37